LTPPSVDGSVVNNPLVAAAPIVHVVQRGETLAVIGRLYNITADEILKANNIPDPNRIFPGQELQIWSADVLTQQDEQIATGETNAPTVISAEAVVLPAAETEATTVPPIEQLAEVIDVIPTPAPEAVTHIVQAGEHLSQIATRYGISWTALAAANNIANPDVIYAGLALTIPDVSADNIFRDEPVIPEEPAAAHVGTGREVVVDLSTQMTYAYEDGVLQYSALVSTGLPGTPTVQGDFAVYLEYDSQTMSGPGYYLENVESVAYFYQGYALHGAYWHNNFGHPMSHGCVNMRNEDAKWFYDFVSIGTPVHVQW
jgi:lipoprotein-anchoring transpeptidase ErfK/SrfK